MMEKFTFIDYNQFSSFMQNKDFQANNIVFWTGAGIDCDTPTCLPLGAALTEKILSWTCGDMGAELFKKWGEICKAVNSLCWPKEKLHLSSIPRLESILERVRLCEKQSSIDGSNNSVMTMISGFSDAPPNPSHYALAKAISEGASVVTTNYSLCVETAFERLTGKKLSPEKVDNTSVYIYSIPNEAVGRIIHIHGVAFDKESIGISLSSVKNELPSQVVEIIKGWLHESKTFIFAGYSASDVFDVNLLFRHMYDERIHGSDSFFIQHSKNNTPRFHTTEELEKVKAVLLPFSYQYVLDANTAKVLELLFPVNLTEIHKLKDFDWVRLGDMVKYSQGRKLDLFVDLCQFFGIDTSKVLEQPLLYSSKEHQTNAFETLYSKHDATKSGFRRELRSELSYDNFKKVFAQFCFITYYQAKIELTYDDIVTVLNKIKGSNGITIFRPEDYLYDLVNSICVLYREGVTYKFTHRSFQEYFSAIFLKELSDQNMEKMGISLVKKDYFRASHDSVFFMLRDMAEQRFEQNILLPFVVEFETTCSDTDKYDFYFEELSPEIFFDEVDFDGEIHLVICADFNVEAVGFIYAMARHYRDTTSSHVKQLKDAEDELRNFLISERDYKIEEKVDLTEYRDDSKLYSLLKATWIGDYLTVMANLREMLEHRRRKEEQDLFELLDE